jgi:hypothetical protein
MPQIGEAKLKVAPGIFCNTRSSHRLLLDR